MEELIKIKKSQGGKSVINARDLHSYLTSNRGDFHKWAMVNIENNEYAIQSTDYHRIQTKAINGRMQETYAITLSFAKELAMMSKCENGKKARKYFIECEEKLKANLPQTFAQALRLAADQQEKIEEQNRVIEEQKPKVLFAESVETSNDSILIGNLAKLISQKGITIGQNKLFAYMRENGFLCSTSNKRNMPTQKSINQKLLEVKESVFIKKNGSESISLTTMVTGKGQIYFINKFKNQDNGR